MITLPDIQIGRQRSLLEANAGVIIEIHYQAYDEENWEIWKKRRKQEGSVMRPHAEEKLALTKL